MKVIVYIRLFVLDSLRRGGQFSSFLSAQPDKIVFEKNKLFLYKLNLPLISNVFLYQQQSCDKPQVQCKYVCMYLCIEVALRGSVHGIGHPTGPGIGAYQKGVQCPNSAVPSTLTHTHALMCLLGQLYSRQLRVSHVLFPFSP